MALLDAYSGFAAVVVILFILIYFFAISVAIAAAVAEYVLYALGLRGMLRSVGFEKTWYGFVPFCNSYALGYLADQYDDGKPKTNYAKKLLKLNIATLALTLPMLFVIVMFAIVMAMTGGSENVALGGMVIVLILIYALYIAMIVLAILLCVNLIKAAWRIYRIFAPEKSILFLMLSIFVSPAMIVIFFIIRNRCPQNLRVENEAGNEAE